MQSNYSRWTLLRLVINCLVFLLLFGVYQRLAHKHSPAKAGDANPSLGYANEQYKFYNKTYFNDALPMATITWLYDPSKRAETEVTDKGYVLKLNPIYNQSETQMVEDILHEQCHIKTWEDAIGDPNILFEEAHGSHWQNCMKDLANRDAFHDIW